VGSAAAAMFDHHKHIQQTKCRPDGDGEVAGNDSLGVRRRNVEQRKSLLGRPLPHGSQTVSTIDRRADNCGAQACYSPRSMLDGRQETSTWPRALDCDGVVFYCGGGIPATSDAFVLAMLGAKDVAVYGGSLSEWLSDPSLPIETG
jgi:hypothetical protein